MDLYAYSQMDDLSDILASTGIEIPRLRGLRLMANETKMTKEELKKTIHEMVEGEMSRIIENLVRSSPEWCVDATCTVYNRETDRKVKKYIRKEKRKVVDEDGKERTKTVSYVRWDRLHGKRRKTAKFAIKKIAKRIQATMETFNQYAGREDVLYVHARIGGGNWEYYGGPEVAKHPAFLEKVDDWFDETYCDIYLKVDKEVVRE